MASPFDGLVAQGGVPATVYDTDATTVRASSLVLLANARAMTVTGERGNDVRGILPSTVVAHAGYVLGVPSITPFWFLVRKVIIHTPGLLALAMEMSLVALPYTLTVTRTVGAVTPMRRNGYGEQYASTDVTTTTRTVPMGASNNNTPDSAGDLGSLPRGITTLYCPLGVDVQLHDQVTLPSGTVGTVQQRNYVDADGTQYGLQLLVDEI